MNNIFFDESVKEKLEGHQAPVPADAWDNINKGKRRRRPMLWCWFFAGLILCGIAGLFIYFNPQAYKTVTAGDKDSLPQLKNNETANGGHTENIIHPNFTKSSNKHTSAIINTGAPTNSTTNNIAGANGSSRHLKAGIQKNTKQPFLVINNTGSNKPAIVATDKTTHQQSGASTATKTNDEDGEYNRVATKTILTNAGSTTMQISGGHITEEDEDNNIAVKHTTEPYEESTPVGVPEEADLSTASLTIPSHFMEKKNDTAIVAARTPNKIKIKSNVDIDISLAGFSPFGNRAAISYVNRTTVTPMNKAAFTADKVTIRLQPSAGVNVMLFKSVSSKTSIGAGLGYQHLKEYIELTGEEVNSYYTVVKRLQNGNSLVQDTVTTVTNGVRSIDAVNSYSLLSIPLAVRYNVWRQNKWTLSFSAGVDISLHSKYDNSIAGDLQPQFAAPHNTSRNNSFGIGYNAGAVLGRRVGKNYFVYLSPHIQLNPKKQFLNEMLSPATINRAGVSLGWSYGF